MARRVSQYTCTCGVVGADRGDLETHVLDFPDGDHQPADPEHVTPLTAEHVETARRRAQVRAKLAQAAGVSVDELREALRGL